MDTVSWHKYMLVRLIWARAGQIYFDVRMADSSNSIAYARSPKPIFWINEKSDEFAVFMCRCVLVISGSSVQKNAVSHFFIEQSKQQNV